jgi:uncharacterized protein YndB with AHSA1/START domain
MAETREQSVSVERHIAAPPDKVFAVLADPAQHPAIDGSGMVRDAPPDGPDRLALGAKFGMAMRWGMPYTMSNEVVEFEEGRRIGWRPRLARPAFISRLGGGHRWRYELEPEGETSTRVRETYDWSNADPFTRAYIVAAQWPERARRAMEETLERLEGHVS